MWEEEPEMHAAYRGADDPKDVPHHLLVHWSIDEDVSAATQRCSVVVSVGQQLRHQP
jgi:hypothetical protein